MSRAGFDGVPLLNPWLPPVPQLTPERVPGAVDLVADPFPLFHEGALHVLAEVQGRRSSGEVFKKIGVFRLGHDLHDVQYLGETWPADDGRYSFPFVCRHEEQYLLVPEVFVPFEGQGAPALQVLQIYATDVADFPFGWTKVHEGLLQGCAAPSDKVLLRQDGRWWLFCSNNAMRELLAYTSTDLKIWERHPLNPVAVGPWRLGGGPLLARGELALPLQHAHLSRTYGGAVTLLRLAGLGQDRVQARLDPQPILAEDPARGWMSRGAHHVALARHGGRTVLAVDGYDGVRWSAAVIAVPPEAGLAPVA